VRKHGKHLVVFGVRKRKRNRCAENAVAVEGPNFKTTFTHLQQNCDFCKKFSKFKNLKNKNFKKFQKLIKVYLVENFIRNFIALY